MTDVLPKQIGWLYIITKVLSSIKCLMPIYTVWYSASNAALLLTEACLGEFHNAFSLTSCATGLRIPITAGAESPVGVSGTLN